MKRPSLAVAATRVFAAATLGALFCSPAAAQGIDYSRLEIKTTDLGQGVYLLNWQGGDSLISGDSVRAAGCVAAAKPTKDFDAQWVHQGNFLNGDAMSRLAYQSLKSARPPTTPS